jgi:hypothetical protein
MQSIFIDDKDLTSSLRYLVSLVNDLLKNYSVQIEDDNVSQSVSAPIFKMILVEGKSKLTSAKNRFMKEIINGIYKNRMLYLKEYLLKMFSETKNQSSVKFIKYLNYNGNLVIEDEIIDKKKVIKIYIYLESPDIDIE